MFILKLEDFVILPALGLPSYNFLVTIPLDKFVGSVVELRWVGNHVLTTVITFSHRAVQLVPPILSNGAQNKHLKVG